MEGHAERIAEQYEQLGRPAAGNTLEEAVWLEEQSLGYPLNLMCSLYYESTVEDPFRHPAEATPPNSDTSDSASPTPDNPAHDFLTPDNPDSVDSDE